MRKLLVCLALLLPIGAYGGISGPTIWEVEPTSGNDNNACGFRTNLTGVDKSTWTPVSLSGLTSAGAGSVILYSGAVASDVGNMVNITGGTNFTPGRFQIISMVAGTSWTTDRAVTTGAGALGTGVAFGPCATISSVINNAISAGSAVGGNIVFVKAESILTITSSMTVTQTLIPPAYNAPRTRIVGYKTTRGDRGMAQIQMSAGSMTQPAVGIYVTGSGVSLENLWVDSNGVATSTGILVNGVNYHQIYNVKATSATSANLAFTGTINSLLVANSEFSYATSAATGSIVATGILVGAAFVNLWVHDNATTGANLVGNDYRGAFIFDSLFSNNTGAFSDGIHDGAQTVVMGCVFYKNGRHGYWDITATLMHLYLRNNIFDQNGGYGIVGASNPGMTATPAFDGNAYYNNALGARLNADDTTVNKQNAFGAYTNVNDVTLTQDPFNNPSANDFTLNISTGGGLLARGEGFPGAIPGLTTTGYRDMGTFQHRDPISREAYVQ